MIDNKVIWMITVNANGPGLIEHFDALRDELMGSGGVSEVAVSSSPTTDVENDMLGYDWKGRDPNSTPAIGTLFVGYDFGKTVGWQLKEGRDFSRDYPTDSGAFVINEAAARYMGLRYPVGEFIRWHDENYPIIGVVRDMVMKSPYSPVEPTFFTLRTDRRIHVITVRLRPGLAKKAALAASVLQLWGLLSREFVVLVLVAFAIAAPIAWFYGQEWLRGFD